VSGTIAGRFEVVRQLGSGSFAETVLARDLAADRLVAIKALTRPGDLKAYELFEREAAVLRSLRHHGVPEIFATLRADWHGTLASLLVMEYIEGQSLAEMITGGRRLAREELLDLLLSLLGVLDYLHGRVPPVLHRDIKPANVVVRPDGTAALVDFGAVRSVFSPPGEHGSTVVGTYGYMPYEQYMGQASPASDLYAVGATVLHVVTGRPPADFMSSEGQLAVPDELPCGEPLRSVLVRLLRPAPGDRYQSARQVRAALFGEPGTAVALPGPSTTAVTVSPGVEALLAELPAGPRRMDRAMRRLVRRIAGSTLELMDPRSPRGAPGFDLASAALVTVFSVITIGILPAVFLSLAATRRRRVTPFVREGVPAFGIIDDMDKVDIGFGEHLTRVRYHFEIDGRTHRGSDQVTPWRTERWRVGDRVELLYLPDREFDSIIVV